MSQIVAENPNRMGWPARYLHHAKENSLIDAGLALLGSGMGFRALWVDGETKRPLTRNGVHDATGYGAELYQAWESLPENHEPGLAITLPLGTAVLDIDTGTPWTMLGRPDAYTATEMTARGWHQFVTLPEPFQHTSKHVRGELRAGPDSYTVIAPSPGKELFILGDNPLNTRKFRMLPDDGAIWINHQRVGASGFATGIDPRLWTDTRYPATDKLINQLVKGRYGATVTMILQGRGEVRYNSRSESDFALLFLCTHFTDDPAILADLLQRYSRKLLDKSTPAQRSGYISLTVSNAIAARRLTDHQRIARIARLLDIPTTTTPTTIPLTVYDANFSEKGLLLGLEGMRKGQRKELLITSLLGWAGMVGCGDEWDRFGGWRRLPVEDFATMFGYSREGIRRVYLGLMAAGLIDRDVPITASDKGARRDTLIRLRGTQ